MELTIKEALREANLKLKKSKISDFYLESQLILANLLGKTRIDLYKNDYEKLNKIIQKKYFKQINLRTRRFPLAYLIKKEKFMEDYFFVDKNVLIPRNETEILVEEVINWIKNNLKGNFKILDLGTGSGVIALSIAKSFKTSDIWASDISCKALNVAKKNAENLNLRKINFIKGNLFKPFNFKFDVIVSNPPYVEKPFSEEVYFEPKIAWRAKNKGLEFYQKIIKSSPLYLKGGGLLALEIGYNQADGVINLLKKNFNEIKIKKDYSRIERIILAIFK
ncbi:MAG: peptide chain release factor N(5)-glutamine methyltransferase [Armatimonadetes bacterium]|nr:peptide chain release factor N(5)-glutamine methyltransferase [Armatimonadota bacterium]